MIALRDGSCLAPPFYPGSTLIHLDQHADEIQNRGNQDACFGKLILVITFCCLDSFLTEIIHHLIASVGYYFINFE